MALLNSTPFSQYQQINIYSPATMSGEQIITWIDSSGDVNVYEPFFASSLSEKKQTKQARKVFSFLYRRVARILIYIHITQYQR
jgi:hypothetical protein